MNDIIITLVFSIVMLIFMVYPAMKVTDMIYKKFSLDKRLYNLLTLLLTVSFSLLIGLFLKYF
jgi:hypothetical protein